MRRSIECEQPFGSGSWQAEVAPGRAGVAAPPAQGVLERRPQSASSDVKIWSGE